MRRTTPLALLAALLLTAGPSAAVDFNDREALSETLTLDEQAPLADADEALAEAEEDLAEAVAERDAAQSGLEAANTVLADAQTALTTAEAEAAASAEAEAAAQLALDGAQAALDQGVADMLPPDQIALLEQALADAQAELDTAAAEAAADAAAEEAAAMSVADAQAAADAAQIALQDAQQQVDATQMAFDEASAVVQAILGEIEGTEEFVESLEDRQVFALNRSLHPAVQTGLLPLDIDLELLSRITEEDLGDREIQALTRGFRFELRFDRKAEQFEEQGKTAQAERFRAKADDILAKNLAMLDGPPGHANQAAKDAVNDAANEAANDAVEEIVKGQGKGLGLASAPGQNKP